MNAVDSVTGAKMRAFVDSLDKRWHWWQSHRDRPVPPIIPDARGLLYLPNYAENYVVAVTPLDHDMVYVAEISDPVRVVSGTLAGHERVLVLTGTGTLHVLSQSLIPLQTLTLHDVPTDLVWAEGTLWIAGSSWNHVESFAVDALPDGSLKLTQASSVYALPNVAHLLWLPHARTLAAVADDVLHFVDPDTREVESVELPTTVQHAAAHDALLVFTETQTGYALVLDLASANLGPLITQPMRQVSEDPIITQHRGIHSRWHGQYTVSIVTVQEPDEDDVHALVQSIEQKGGSGNTAQPEIVVHLQEKADFFRLPTVRHCMAGESYESDPFVLSGDGDPLMVVAEGASMVLPPLEDDPDQIPREVFAAWLTDEEIRLRRQYNAADGLQYRARVQVFEPVTDTLAMADWAEGEAVGTKAHTTGFGETYLTLENPTAAEDFWVGSFTTKWHRVDKMSILNAVRVDGTATLPLGTSVTLEWRIKYRNEQQVAVRVSDWSETAPELPEEAEPYAVQARLYLVTNDLELTPAIYGLSLDRIRFEALTTGFWDTHRSKAVRACVSAPMQSASQSMTAIGGGSEGTATHKATSTPHAGMAPAGLQRLKYVMGDKLAVQWQDQQYTLHRVSAQYRLGRITFSAAPSLPTDWWNVQRIGRFQQQWAGSQRVSAHVPLQGSQLGPMIDLNGASANAESQHLINAHHPLNGAAGQQSTRFLPYRAQPMLQLTLLEGHYSNTYTLGDVKRYLAVRAFATKMDYHSTRFAKVSHTMAMGRGYQFGASYGLAAGSPQTADFAHGGRGGRTAARSLQPTNYHAPLVPAEVLASTGEGSRKGILGLDTDNYTASLTTQAVGYDALVGALRRLTSQRNAIGMSAGRSQGGKTVRDALLPVDGLPPAYHVAQQVTSWRDKVPLHPTAGDQSYVRNIVVNTAAAEEWLASNVAARRTLQVDPLHARNLSHFVASLADPLHARAPLTPTRVEGRTIRLRAVLRSDMGLDPMAAYPAQSYKTGKSRNVGYRPVRGFSQVQESDLSAYLGTSNSSKNVGKTLSFTLATGARIHEMRDTIRFALDWLAMRPAQDALFSETGGHAGRLSDAVLLSRSLPQRAATNRSGFSMAVPTTGESEPRHSDRDHRTTGESEPRHSDRDHRTTGTADIEMIADEATLGSIADPLSYVFQGITTPLAEKVYSAIFEWAGKTAGDRIRFARDLINAETGQGMQSFHARLHGAASELITLTAQGRPVSTAGLIRFMTAAYLTGNLPQASAFASTASTSIPSIVELLYKTYESTSHSGSYVFDRDQLNSAARAVAFQLLADAAKVEQDCLFDRLRGIGTTGTQKALYQLYRWQGNIGGRITTMWGRPRQLTAYSAEEMRPWHSHMPSVDQYAPLTLIQGLTLTQGEAMRYRPHTGATAAQARALEATHGDLSVVASAGLHSTMHLQTRTITGNEYDRAAGATRPTALSRLIRGSGQRVMRERVGLSVSVSVHGGEAGSRLRMETGAHAAASRKVLSAFAQVGTLEGDSVGWHFHGLSGESASARILANRGGTRLQRTTYWDRLAPHQYGEQSTTLQVASITMAETLPVYTGRQHEGVWESGSTEFHRPSSTAAASRTEGSRSGRIGLTSPVIRANNDVTLSYGEQEITLTVHDTALTAADGPSARAGGWQSRLQSHLMGWAIDQLQGLPQSVLLGRDSQGMALTEAARYRLTRAGLSVGELVKLLPQATLRHQHGVATFQRARWSDAAGQARYLRTSNTATRQRAYLTRGAGQTARQQRMPLTAAASVSGYWKSQLQGSISNGQQAVLATNDASKASTTGSALSRAHFTRSTLDNAVSARMVATLWMQPTADAGRVGLLRQRAQRITVADALDFQTFSSGRWDSYFTGTRTLDPRMAFSGTRASRAAGTSLHLGARVAISAKQALFREIRVEFSKQTLLTAAERMVLMGRALANAVNYHWSGSVDQHTAAEVRDAKTRLLGSGQGVLPDAPAFHVSPAQQYEMARTYTRSIKSMNGHLGLPPNILPHHQSSAALTAVEASVLDWAYTVVEAGGEKMSGFTGKTLDEAIPLIRQATAGTRDVEATAVVFGRQMTDAEVFAQVVQPVATLQKVLYQALSGMPQATLMKIGGYFEKGLRAKVTSAALRKYQAIRLKEVAVVLSRTANTSLALQRLQPADTGTMRSAATSSVTLSPAGLSLASIQSNAFHLAGRGMVPQKAGFLILSGLNLPTGGRMPLADITTSTSYHLASSSKGFHLQHMGASLNSAYSNAQLNKITAHVETARIFQTLSMSPYVEKGRNPTLSYSTRYWIAKFRHVFPLQQANYLQDYGPVSAGLQNLPVHNTWLRDEHDDKLGSYANSDTPETRVSIVQTTPSAFHPERPSMSESTHKQQSLWHRNHRASASSQSAALWLMHYRNHSSYRVDSHQREMLSRLGLTSKGARQENQTTLSTRQQEMVVADIESRMHESQVFTYSFMRPEGTPQGPTGWIRRTVLDNPLQPDVRLVFQRAAAGMDLIEARPIGERFSGPAAKSATIKEWANFQPHELAVIVRKIRSAVVTMLKQVDDLQYSRLTQQMTKDATLEYTRHLTDWASTKWDYSLGRFYFNEVSKDEVIRIVEDNAFWRNDFSRTKTYTAEFTRDLFRLLNEAPREIDWAYRQDALSESSMLHALVQSSTSTIDVDRALRQAGLSHTQVDRAMRQSQETLVKTYRAYRQAKESLSRYATWDYENGAVAAKEVDRMYRQRETSEKALYQALRETGLSDQQLQRAYEQIGGFGLSTPVVQSAYRSYDSMVNEVGRSFEQYLMSDQSALLHYRMQRNVDGEVDRRFRNEAPTTPDVIELYKRNSTGVVGELDVEFAVDMATVLGSVDYSLMKPLPFHDRLDINLPLTFRSEDFRRYKAGIVAIDLMEWLRDLRTSYREELIAKVQAGTAKGSYSPRVAMKEAIRNAVVEPILYRDPDDGSWLYRRYSFGDTEYNYIVWGSV